MKANNAENSAEQEKIKLRTTMIFTVPYKSWLCRMWPVNKDGNSKMDAPSKLKSNFLCYACKVKLWILTFWRWFCTMIFTLTYKSWLCRIWPVSEDGSMEQLQNRSPTFSAIHVQANVDIVDRRKIYLVEWSFTIFWFFATKSLAIFDKTISSDNRFHFYRIGHSQT